MFEKIEIIKKLKLDNKKVVSIKQVYKNSKKGGRK